MKTLKTLPRIAKHFGVSVPTLRAWMQDDDALRKIVPYFAGKYSASVADLDAWKAKVMAKGRQ